MAPLELLKLLLIIDAGIASFLALILFAVYSHFRRQPFFRWWTWAWALHAVFLAVSRYSLGIFWTRPLLKAGTLLAALLLGLLQIPFLLDGVRAFRGAVFKARVFRWELTAAVAIGLALFFFSLGVRGDPALGFHVRQVIRGILSCAVFTYCSYMFFAEWRKTKSKGTLLAIFACGATAAMQLVFELSWGSRWILLLAPVSVGTANGEGQIPAWIFVDILCQLSLAAGTLLLVLERQAASENALHELQHQFQQAQKMEAVGRLAGGVAHDFNNVLMVIRSYSELLLDQLHDPAQRHKAEQVVAASHRGATLAKQLLAFSRRQSIAPEALDLNWVVREMEDMLRRLIGEHIELRLQLAQPLSRCQVDAVHLQQIVMNLAINSRDAMPGGGSLLIATADAALDAGRWPSVPPGNYVMLAVTDTGLGIAPAVQEHIFEPFFTTKEVGKGTGLGLSIVYGIVKQNHGYIVLDSVVGRGTTFRLFFPQVTEPAAAALPAVVVPAIVVPPVPRADARVLLVEDEDALREAGAEALRAYGFTVAAVRSGAEALRLAREAGQHFDLLVTDVIMPGMPGPDLAKALVQLQPAIRVVYMSGYTADRIQHAAAGHPEGLCLQKPFSFQYLGQKLVELLQS
jgi:signal transduction histidine kinase